MKDKLIKIGRIRKTQKREKACLLDIKKRIKNRKLRMC